jgi:hypothetical protein
LADSPLIPLEHPAHEVGVLAGDALVFDGSFRARRGFAEALRGIGDCPSRGRGRGAASVGIGQKVADGALGRVRRRLAAASVDGHGLGRGIVDLRR